MYLYDERYEREYEGETTYWNVGVLLTRIGEIDIVPMRQIFWLFVEIHEEDEPTYSTVNPPEFNFINGRHIEFDAEYAEEKYWEVKIRVEFFNQIDFRNFPFETLNLKIEIEPEGTERTLDKIRFVLDPNGGIDKSATVPGWETGEFRLSVVGYFYDENDPDSTFNWSKYTVGFFVERSTTGSLVKNILLVSIITGSSLLIFSYLKISHQ